MARNALERMATPPKEKKTGNEVATRPRSALEERQDDLARFLRKMSTEIAAAVPEHITPERMIRVATTVMRTNPDLATCDPLSFVGAVMTCAQVGLEPGPGGRAYLVPRRSKKTGKVECVFQMGYKGQIELARRSGQIDTIYAEAVYELDEFYYEKGLNPDLKHVPYDGDVLEGSLDNPLTHVYAIVKYRGGGFNFVVLTKAGVEKYRQRSDAPNSPAWRNDYEAMAKKTAIRRLEPYMPQSVEYQQATAAEGRVRTDARLDALDELGTDPMVIDAESVSAPPAQMDPETGEIPADIADGEAWPEVARAGDAS